MGIDFRGREKNERARGPSAVARQPRGPSVAAKQAISLPLKSMPTTSSQIFSVSTNFLLELIRPSARDI